MTVYIEKNDIPDRIDSLISAFWTATDEQLNKPLLYTSSRKKTEILNIGGAIIKDVIFNDPATIVMWSDGDKTVVKCQAGDKYNPELGLAMCIVKKCCGNKGNYNDVFKKWIQKEGGGSSEK